MEFLPPVVCQSHRLVGYCEECTACKRFPGWVQLEPIKRKWQFKDEVLEQTFGVERTQFPLIPQRACSLYTLQGATTEQGMIAHLSMPGRMDADMKWLTMYVILSRVRSLDTLRTTGMHTEKDATRIRGIMEGGPPTMITEVFERYFKDKIDKTKVYAKEARTSLGW